MKLLENKIAIVTGAARGIGEAIAIKLAEHGAHIAFTYVSESSAEKASALVSKLEGLGVKAKAWRSNAGNFSESESFVNDVVKEFGTVDVCVNNAGISKDNLLLRMTPEQWDEVMEINLKSVFNMTKQVIRPMMKAKKRIHHQHEFHYWNSWKRRTIKLCGQQGWNHRFHKIHSTGAWKQKCSCQCHCTWIY